MTPEQTLADLHDRADAAKRRYFQVLGDINAKKAQLSEAKATLAELGCNSLAEADEKIAELQADLDARLAEIRQMLG